MKIYELLENLTAQGVQLSVQRDKLNIRSPKGILTPELQSELAIHKAAILAFLQEIEFSTTTVDNQEGLNILTIGHLIGGLSQNNPDYKPPVINPKIMAQKLSVTFRPLPKGYDNSAVLNFRTDLEAKLREYNVKVMSWEEATTKFHYKVEIPLLKWQKKITTRVVKTGVNAVIDVERPPTLQSRSKHILAETIYKTYLRFIWKQQKMSVTRIAKVIGWAEEGAAKYIEDPTNTQVIVLTELDQDFVNPELPYRKKIEIGLNTLVRTFSELVIGVSEEQISILNMNLSDSLFKQAEIDRFVLNSLIPKIFVPILPLPISRFTVETFNPKESPYSEKLVDLGKKLGETGLLPPGSQLSNTIKRKSHRDIVSFIVDGRTGVSYGFVAYLEPPKYVGKREITEAEWDNLQPVTGLSEKEVRCNDVGRRYLKTKIGDSFIFQQIPDIWLISSRSGSDKTDLSLERDIIRIGLLDKLCVQFPETVDLEQVDMKPSYDVFVMIAIALSTALYSPKLSENGAPLVHFHGYPSREWFTENEHYFGINNPSVPCGTYESGVLNFMGMHNLTQNPEQKVALVSLIEPDHGTNIIASDPEYLMKRLQEGSEQGQIELGGKYFASLKESR